MYTHLIIKYAEYKSIIYNYIKYIKSYITDIHSIKGYINNNTINLHIRYIIIYLLQKIINYFDKNYELIEIKKIVNNNNTTIILENTTILNTIQSHSEYYATIPKMNYLPKVHTKFEICFPNKVCLKKFLLEYKNYTLENIFKINNIKTNEDTIINVQYFEKGIKKEVVHKYIDIKEMMLGLI